MTKVKLLVELEYDANLAHGEGTEGKEWFFGSILSGDEGLLLLHSNALGETLGKVTIIGRIEP